MASPKSVGHDWQVDDKVWWRCSRCLCWMSREIMKIPNPDLTVTDDIERKEMTCEEVQLWRIHHN